MVCPGEMGFCFFVKLSEILILIPIIFFITSGVIIPWRVIDKFFFDKSNIVDSRPKFDFPESIISSIFFPNESDTCRALVDEI